MSSPADGPPPSPSFEDVLIDALARFERQGQAGIEAAIAAHPTHAATLRSHLERLQRLGLLTAAAPSTPAEPDAPAAAPQFPERLGDFRLLQRLGGGGMGVVYLAEQQSLGRRVALKLVRADFLHHPVARERFRREVDAIAKLQHPGIVPVHDAGEDGGVPWLAMELVVGASLDEVLHHFAGRDPVALRGDDMRRAVLELTATRRDAKDSVGTDTANTFAGTWTSTCLRIARAIALALQHAHERGVLHRDVKPSNVMLTPDGRVLLLDFGLATSQDGVRMTGTGHALGTPAYMSPEQMRGDSKAIDGRTDVYSLGVTLYELLALHIPYAAATAHGIRELALAGRVTPLRAHHRGIARDVEIVCSKAIDAEPAHRYGDIAAFAADLTNLLELRPIAAVPPSTWRALRRAAQRHPARTVAAAAAVLLFLVAPTVFLLQQQAAKAEIAQALQNAREQERLAKLARDAARTQRDLAREAVDTMLTHVADEDLVGIPGLQDVRSKLLGSARDFYERFLADSAGDPDLLDQTARAALKVLFLDGRLGRTTQSQVVADRAVELARELEGRRPGDTASALLLADALLTRGRIEYLRVDFAAAGADFAEARRRCEEVLGREPHQAVAVTHQLGVERGALLLAMATGDDEGFTAALASLNELWDRVADVTAEHDYAEVMFNHVLATLVDAALHFHSRGDRERAVATLDRCDAVAAVARAPQLTLDSRLMLAQAASLRASLAAAEQDIDSQEAALRESLRLADTMLLEHPGYVNALRLRAHSTNQLGLLLGATPGRERETEPLYESSIATLRQLVAADDAVLDNQANLASTLVNLGALYQDREPQRALRCFQEAEALAGPCHAAAPSRAPWQLALYNSIWFQGQILGQLGDHTRQAAAAERLLAVRPDDGRTHRIAAQLTSAALGAATADPALTGAPRTTRLGELTARALQLLRSGAELGCADAAWLREHPDFAALRGHAEFPALLQRYEANERAAKPGGDR